MISVVPTILARTRQEFDTRFAALKPHFLKAHLDVLDNTLVNGESFYEAEYIGRQAGSIKFEVHLMVDLDEYDLSIWNRPWVEKIVVHCEAAGVAKQFSDMRSWGKQLYIAINPDTQTGVLKPHLTHSDGCMVMTVMPGHMGAPFQPQALDTITWVRKHYSRLPIEADGGVSNETLLSLLDLGVSTVAVGSYLKNENVENRLFDLIALLERFETRQQAHEH